MLTTVRIAKICGWLMFVFFVLAFLLANLIGGVIGTGLFLFLTGFKLNPVLAYENNFHNFTFVCTEITFFVCFFGTACLIGGSRFGDIGYRINKWVESHRPRLVKWYHNGVTGLAPEGNYDSDARNFWLRVNFGSEPNPGNKPVRHSVPGLTMTFSDFKCNKGKVTGTMADLEQLVKGCIVSERPLEVPGTSGSRSATHRVITLDEAYKIVHNKRRK